MQTNTNQVAELARIYLNNTNKNLFLTGKAGTGKTTFLTEIKNHTFKNVVVAAPTGIAAINAGGVTLHSLFHLPFGTFIPDNKAVLDNIHTPQSVLANLKMGKPKRIMLRELELLIIDEVSMLRADVLDCIDTILRSVRRKHNLPFGGVQLLLIGDLYQLPPVVKNHEWQLLSQYYSSMYFFNSLALRQAPPVYIELNKIYRQSDQPFIDLLNRLRNNQLTPADIDLLNAYYKPDFNPGAQDGYVYVTTHNYKADNENLEKLNALPGKSKIFKAEVKGDFPENMYPAAELLELKVGAQVMFIKNDTSADKQYYNGKIGTLTHLSSDKLTITCAQGKETICLEPDNWENIRYKMDKDTGEISENYLGSFTQFPIRLAWAITVHKSQGLTFDKAILDLSDVFAPGQMYVALSRLTSLDGLVLVSPVSNKVFNQDQTLQSFAAEQPNIEQLQAELQTATQTFLKQYISSAFYFGGLLQELQSHMSGFSKEENRSAKQPYLSWTQLLVQQVAELHQVGNKFRVQVAQIIEQQPEVQMLAERLAKAEGYFDPLLTNILNQLEEHQTRVSERKRIKGYLSELQELTTLISIKLLAIKKAKLLVQQISEGKMLTKQEIQTLYEQVEKRKPVKKGKKAKVPTAEISFGMYRQGKTIAEIAKERGLVESTIIGHLCKYVANGQLEAANFIETSKLNKIVEMALKLDTRNSGELKGALSNSYSYQDIKMALAHIASME